MFAETRKKWESIWIQGQLCMCKRVRFRTREKENVSITFRSNKLCIKRSKHYIYHVKLSIELRCVIYTLLCFYTYWNLCCHKILLLVCSVRSQIYYSNIIALYAPPIKIRSISSNERHGLNYCNEMESCSETFVRVVIMHTKHTIVAFWKILSTKCNIN